jgi:chromosome segregation ATPase
MNKKLLILIATAGLVFFAGSFAVGWFTAPQPQNDANSVSGLEKKGVNSEKQKQLSQLNDIVNESEQFSRNLSENELERLIFEARQSIRDYEQKHNQLKIRQSRLENTKELIDKDIEELNELRYQLNQSSTEIKEQLDKLRQVKVEIDHTKKDNLVALASTYDRMKSDSAGKILADMTKLSESNRKEGINDAIKILYYMSDRTKAKVLEEVSKIEPELAAVFCNKLKYVTENN